ncbi:MAG: sulfite exporter TauE/SafE family protein [Oscillospiraceae bacterium]|jgi:uncharacterized membrane protein YfcA|nr:sulfite exporter TauE/SafE family protein [Oscillospiraceae bacterium]
MFIAAFLTGIMASLGLGGGMVLIIYLTLFDNFSQISAQGINLVFFIPIAVLSLIFHTKNKLVDWKIIIPIIIIGAIGAVIGSFFASVIDTTVLSKLFGGFVLIIGFKELFSKSKTTFKRKSLQKQSM